MVMLVALGVMSVAWIAVVALLVLAQILEFRQLLTGEGGQLYPQVFLRIFYGPGSATPRRGGRYAL
jgi:hypothetical protein